MIDTSRIHGNRMVGMEANIVKFGRGGVLGWGSVHGASSSALGYNSHGDVLY